MITLIGEWKNGRMEGWKVGILKLTVDDGPWMIGGRFGGSWATVRGMEDGLRRGWGWRIVPNQFEANSIQFGLFRFSGPGIRGKLGGKEGVPGIVPICYLN
jgi:hypothetical protein